MVHKKGDKMEKLLTTKELCEMLKVSRITIQMWIKEGLPVEIKTGKTHRFKYEPVREWLNNKRGM